MYKLVVCDLDGTLLHDDYQISTETKEMIALLHERNVYFTIATGRPNELIKEYVEELNIKIPVITCNGSVIYSHYTKEVLFSEKLDRDVVARIIQFAEKEEIDILVYGTDFIAANDNERYRYFIDRNQTLKSHLRGNFVLLSDNIEKVNHSDINKILLIEGNEDKYQKILQMVENMEGISVTRSKGDFIDIGPKLVSKGDAVKRLALSLNVPSTQVITFGDQYNDISMLTGEGLGIAMGNAVEKVKEMADEVTLSNEENGVYHSLKKIIEMGQL